MNIKTLSNSRNQKFNSRIIKHKIINNHKNKLKNYIKEQNKVYNNR